MLHVVSTRCVAHDLHTTVPRPLERTYWRQFTGQSGDCKNSQIVPLNAIMMMMTMVMKVRPASTALNLI